MADENKTAAAPNFEQFFLSEMSVLDLELPDGALMLWEGKQCRVRLYGPSTQRNIKAREMMNREATKRVIAAMGRKNNKKNEYDDDADVKFLLAVTDSFENFPYPGGSEAIYREPRLKYIADQVRSHLDDMGNFFQAGKKV